MNLFAFYYCRTSPKGISTGQKPVNCWAQFCDDYLELAAMLGDNDIDQGEFESQLTDTVKNYGMDDSIPFNVLMRIKKERNKDIHNELRSATSQKQFISNYVPDASIFTPDEIAALNSVLDLLKKVKLVRCNK